MRATSRAVTFVLIACAVPAAACKFLKHDEADAGATTAATDQPSATATASAAQTAAATTAAPVATVTPAPVAHKAVVVKLPDGGKATVDAGVLADGAVVLPPGLNFPTFPGFDAAALPTLPNLAGFDAAALPKLPTALPSGFPQFPAAPK